MSIYRSVDEVIERLNTRIPQDQLSYVKGQGGNSYSYVPWDKSVRILNDIFGPFGWKEQVIDFHGSSGVYSATVRITVYALTSDGTIIETSRDGVGVGIAQGDHIQAHDTAIKGAASDGLSRAVKLLGDAFGMFLYDRGDPARTQTTQNTSNYTPRNTDQTPTNNGQANEVRPGGPSPAQVTHLGNNGIGIAQATALTKQQATQILGLIWPKDGSAPMTGPQAYDRIVHGVGANSPQLAGVATTNGRAGDDFKF